MLLSREIPAMMGFRGLFESRESEPDQHDHLECRHCGTTFEELPDECPVCDRTEFAAYTLA